jgi:hypothetical protein
MKARETGEVRAPTWVLGACCDSQAAGYHRGVGLFAFYLGLAAIAAVGLWRTMQAQSESRRYLEAGHDDAPPELGHLEAPLAHLVQDARALRLSLEGPLRQLKSVGVLGALGSDAEELDSKLLEATRELGEWLASVDRLGASDRRRLDELSPEAERVRNLFAEEQYALERKLRRRGRPPLRESLERLLDELGKFEVNMQRAQSPYR